MDQISDANSYMTVNEFCERLQISTSTAYQMIKRQQIPAIKFGRRCVRFIHTKECWVTNWVTPENPAAFPPPAKYKKSRKPFIQAVSGSALRSGRR